jgi:hypothetical protein
MARPGSGVRRQARAGPYIPSGVGVSWALAGGETAHCGDAPYRQWRGGECARAAGQSHHGEWGVKKRPARSPVNKYEFGPLV